VREVRRAELVAAIGKTVQILRGSGGRADARPYPAQVEGRPARAEQ